MQRTMTTRKINLLMCAPGEKCAGGISAVVFGLMSGLGELDTIACTSIAYAKPKDNISVPVRIVCELLQYAKYVKQLFSIPCDIVHVQSTFDKKAIFRDFLYLFWARMLGKKFILHAHGGVWDQCAQWSAIWKLFSVRFLETCSTVLVTSEEEHTLVREISEHIKVAKIDNPVLAPIDISALAGESRARKSGKTRVIFASRHIETKGILDCIKAFSLLERSDCELHVFGDGPLRDTAVNLAKTLGIDSRIKFHGNVPLPDLILEYLDSDIYLFPSYHHEGFPMSLFFAVACSLSIICTKVRPLPDILHEPENCLWVEPSNPELLAEKMNHLLNHRDLQKAMSKHNRKLSEKFTPQRIASELEKIYASLLYSQ